MLGKVRLERLKRANKEQMYDIFLVSYQTGTENYVPLYKEINTRKQDWFNTRCGKAKEKRGDSCIKYARVLREEQKGYERVEKCEEDPKLFYRFINCKIKPKEKNRKTERWK